MTDRKGRNPKLTLNRLAVSGSIILRTSFTSSLTLEPTSPAPTRMTMVFGDLLMAAAPFFTLGFPSAGAFRCVRLF
jgi:hypothetical protein